MARSSRDSVSHFVIYCRGCGLVVSTCRCPSLNKKEQCVDHCARCMNKTEEERRELCDDLQRSKAPRLKRPLHPKESTCPTKTNPQDPPSPTAPNPTRST